MRAEDVRVGQDVVFLYRCRGRAVVPVRSRVVAVEGDRVKLIGRAGTFTRWVKAKNLQPESP